MQGRRWDMGKSYSMDLRTRVIEAHDNAEGSIEELAVRFKLSVATLSRWFSRYRKTGHFGPLPHGGGNTPALAQEHLEQFRALVLDNNDATEEELRLLWNQNHEPVSRSVIHRALVKLKLTRKKNAAGRRGQHTQGQGPGGGVREGGGPSGPQGSGLP